MRKLPKKTLHISCYHHKQDERHLQKQACDKKGVSAGYSNQLNVVKMCFRLNICKLHVLIQRKVTEGINPILAYKAKAFIIHFNIYMV